MYYTWDCDKESLKKHKKEYTELLENTSNKYLLSILPNMISDITLLIERD